MSLGQLVCYHQGPRTCDNFDVEIARMVGTNLVDSLSSLVSKASQAHHRRVGLESGNELRLGRQLSPQGPVDNVINYRHLRLHLHRNHLNVNEGKLKVALRVAAVLQI